MFKKILSLFGIRQPATLTPVGNEATEAKTALRTIPLKKRKRLNLVSQQHHIKSERQRVAAALQRDKASSEKNLDQTDKSFSSGLYRGSR